MASMAVDTLTLARELKAAEVPPVQAEAIAAAIGRSAFESMDFAATKSDLAQLQARLEAKIEAVQSKLIMYFLSTQVALGAVIIAALKL